MRKKLTSASTFMVVLAALLLISGSAAAADNSTTTGGDDEDDDTIVNIDLDEVVEAIEDLLDEIQELKDDLGEIVTEAAVTVLFKPFQLLAQSLSDLITHVIISYPDVKNDDVLELHHLIFRLSLLLGVAGLILIGINHVLNRKHGLRPTVYLLAMLVAGGVAPWLLWYPVELSRLSAVVLRPENPGLWTVTRLSLGLVLVAVLEAILLLGVVLLFVVRDIYLMFYVAASPLIFLGFAVPYTRRFSSTLTGTFTAFLLIGPLDLIVYRLTLSLLEASMSELPHWIWAVGGLTLMFALPFYVVSSGRVMVNPAITSVSNTYLTQTTVNQDQGVDEEFDQRRQERRSDSRFQNRGRY